jgi:hypothetical protein
MRKTVLTFGLISGAIVSAMQLITLPFQERIGFDKGMIVGYATMVAASLLVYFGVRRYRDAEAGGRIGFWRAFGVGTLIVLVAAACYTATWEVAYFKLGLFPDFAELETRRAEMARYAAMYRNPAINAAMTFVEPLPVGLAAALISAGLLRRRRENDGAPELAPTG